MAHNAGKLIIVLGLLVAGVAPTFGQSIPTRGTGHTLEVATWNLEFFGDPNQKPPDDERVLDKVEEVIRGAQIDLWALQEIREPSFFYRLLDSLGSDYAGQLGPDTYLRLGFVYRTEVLQNVQPVQQILQTQSADFAGRPPLRLDARVVLPDTSFEATFINVHMKARSDAASYEKRRRAAQALKTYIDVFLTSRAVVLLGDFNDELEQSIYAGKPSPYQPLVADSLPSPDPQYYFFPTLFPERSGAWTLCGWQSFIDHIAVTDELKPLYEPGSAAPFTELLSAIPGYCSVVSDHLPVYARFRRPTSTDIEIDPLLHPHLQVYPIPFDGELTVEVVGRIGEVLRLELFDLLGRKVTEKELLGFVSGPIHWEVGRGLAPGLYFLRITGETYQVTTKVVHR